MFPLITMNPVQNSKHNITQKKAKMFKNYWTLWQKKEEKNTFVTLTFISKQGVNKEKKYVL